jgi:hypothetical protein
MVHRLNSWEQRISCVVHPEAAGVIESDKFGGIRTEQGAPAVVFQTGLRVDLAGADQQEAAYRLALAQTAGVLTTGERVAL